MRRERLGLATIAKGLARTPNAGWAILVGLGFAVVCGIIAMWAREQPMVAVGRVMNTTEIARCAFRIDDIEKTDTEREMARQQTPRVYNADRLVLETIETSIANLPRTLATVETLDQLQQEIKAQYRLSTEALQAIRAELGENGEPSVAWLEKARLLGLALRHRPVLDSATYQRETQRGLRAQIELRFETEHSLIDPSMLVNLRDEKQMLDGMTAAAREAGFTEPALGAIVARLISSPEPTALFDPTETTERQNAAAALVPPVVTEVPVGQVLFTRGEVLTQAQLDRFARELQVFRDTAESYRVWFRRVSVLGAVGAVTLALAGYLWLYCPRVRGNPERMAGLAVLLAGALSVGVWGSVLDPRLLMLTAVAPTVFIAVILVVVYDQRVAMAVGVLHGVLVCIALDQQIGLFALMVTGIGAAIWQLREIRDRQTLVRMSIITGSALALGTVVIALIDRPINATTLVETVYDAAFAAGGGLLVGGVTLFILPNVERAFDITTGLTLIELRDPKHPLLRELQQRAPGTYNHSLNVASIAEAAADAIGADALLTYVGSLYHDVGKMNKPDYFVENQSGGPNRHDKLSPAMSLLVIVGHVKDGLELAREFALPRTLQHFIEAHHGTTLVEYFFHRARQKAERLEEQGEDQPEPQEIEYRYPGPKPQTKEVAILMLADAVESATRSMAEPTPGRIEALVHELANKRLMDGQFDECELTLRDLNLIVESIIKSVASIYHARIAYPTPGPEERRA
jgi:putative nucleotidyltransferase with HDIG domain